LVLLTIDPTAQSTTLIFDSFFRDVIKLNA